MSLPKFLRRTKAEVPPVTEPELVDSSKEKSGLSQGPLSGIDDVESFKNDEIATVVDPDLNPGELTFEEDTAGGMGRHLGVFSCTLLVVGRIIGTGIFSTPSSILGSVQSVGASLMLWVLGFALSFCGLFIWLEFGTMLPRSGGEKVYLEAVYRKPKYLATTLFAANAIILGFSASNCIVFASNILVSADQDAGRWATRGIAIAVIIFVTIVHGLTPRLGILIMNGLTFFKIVILVFIVITGWVVLAGHTSIKDPHANFRNAFANSSNSSNDYATATFKVLFAYSGWSNINYVMNNVKNPVRTLKIAGPLGLGICATLYVLANVAYFAAATKEEIAKSGVTVASLFLGKVFGSEAQNALTVFIALRRVFQISNPVLSDFTSQRTWECPHVSVDSLKTINPQDIYGSSRKSSEFILMTLTLGGSQGLFWLRWKKPNAIRPFKGSIDLL
ncbi:hypothetical protein PHLCEN_2v690 [Hermanssonia centrifuga]|uniref:High affinity methionine permease n=1 Tax=Hermanssonia centrifuga TaxID=98765 RepID=A0A2R6S5F2_9APHY|nr:hypothetical protein PHLCEN_2v690 [Hermanssonia centrifuga]